MNNNVVAITDSNISIAWAKAFLAVHSSGSAGLTSLFVSIVDLGGEEDPEEPKIRQILDNELQKSGKALSSTVASTVFPQSLWNPSQKRQALYDRYEKGVFPRLHYCRANQRGTYFQRMIAFPNGEEPSINQLEQVLQTWEGGNHRHTALQLSIFDPRNDHKHSKRMGFPCLHQVCITPLGPNGSEGLAITGFYATQHIFNKAYGNYLGLYRLGKFIAHEIGLNLVQVNCIASLARMCDSGIIKKESLDILAKKLEKQIRT